MSNRGHSGRCFRSFRRTKARKERQGAEPYEFPIRYKVPLAIRPFLANAAKNQCRAQHEQMGLAIARYAEHQRLTGKGPKVRAAGQARGS